MAKGLKSQPTPDAEKKQDPTDTGSGAEKKPRGRAPRENPGRDPVFDEVTDYVARVVQRTRKDLNMTQHELSEKAGFTSTAIFMIEAQRQNLTLKSLVGLATALGLQVGDLFPKSGKKRSTKLRELAGVIEEVGSRIAIHTKSLERISREILEESDD